MMNSLMIFEGKEVEVFEFNGQVLFNPYHCGECLNLGKSAVRMAIKKMNQNQVVKLKNPDVKDIDIRKLNNAGKNFLTESGVYKLIFKSHKEEAERFQDWVTDEVLPTLRKTGSYTIKKANKEEFEMQLLGAEYSARILRMDTTSQIKMLETVHKNYGVPTNHLPAYVDEEVTKSLTALLKENGFTQRAAEVNTILIAKGFMEIKERPNIKKGVKEFKSLTEKGLRYGKNIISPRQPKETQPHFYQSTFMELMEAIGLVEGSVSAWNQHDRFPPYEYQKTS